MLVISLASFGCAATPRSPSLHRAAGPGYLVAVRYDVTPVAVREGENTAATIGRDFRKIVDLGFAGVVVRHLDDLDRQTILDAAGEAGLTTVLPIRVFKHYVATGSLPQGCPDVETLVGSALAGETTVKTIVRTGIDCGTTGRTTQRATSLCNNTTRAGAACVTFGGIDTPGGQNALTVIDTTAESANAEASPVESWLAEYHRGLIAGQTAGLVVDRYHRPAGDPPGLVSPDQPPGPAEAAAIGELITRARLWGPRLHRMTAESVAATLSPGLEVWVAALARGPRRYVLVFNPSLEHYARGQVLLPDAIGGEGLKRAVEVPTSKATLAGRVVHPNHGRIALAVALRPGDAALFELF